MFKEGQLKHLFIFSLSFVALIPTYSFAGLGVKLLMRSSSGQTLILNKGHLDGVEKKEVGVLLGKIVVEGQSRVVPVANIEVVKIVDNRSTWAASEVFHPALLLQDETFFLLTYTESMRGRRPVKTQRRRLIQHYAQEDKKVQQLKENTNDELVKIHDVALDKRVYSEETQLDYDVELIDLSQWRARKVVGELTHRDMQKVYPVEIYRSPHEKDFQKNIRIKTYDNMVANYLQKVNDPDFVKEIDQQHQSKVSPLSTYAQYMQRKRKRWQRQEKLYGEIIENNQRWSEDLSDKELAKTLADLGGYAESKRLYRELKDLTRHQIKLSLGMGMDSTPVSRGTAAPSENLHAVIAWEYFLGSKYTMLSKLSWEVAAHRAFASASAQGRDLNIMEDAIEVGMNWYPWQFPDIVGEYLYYFGVKYRYGRANIEQADSDFRLWYATSAPVFQVGFKHLFNPRFGIQTQLQYAGSTFRRIERKDPSEPLVDRLSRADMRLAVALTISL